MADIKTRFLVISDTHADEFSHPQQLPPVDVAIHCGDLTEESKIGEFRTTLDMLRSINAPLKLVIAGNHDFTMDVPLFKPKVAESNRLGVEIEPAMLKKEYGDYGEARRLFEEAVCDGIVLLGEGVHVFDLQNGARLTVYASPFTPSIIGVDGGGAFQFKRDDGHDFTMIGNINVAITHSPPRGVLDMADSTQRGGCDSLFAAVAAARPRMHCFGHIHEGWSAKLATWRPESQTPPSQFTTIDNGQSVIIETLSALHPKKFDTPEMAFEKI
ncbi:ser/Thr protein phosphatase family protein [Apodospora peruviana]|uniref:Ser/Thr protein phosphatase family protein n=1 Tax=Apodospora peruviana TaxID=516989 RepID=A0AAE0I4G9_9PEZI|nr:ser/Thr protein phosphatase family protein [Apodospora peruviana]